MTLLQTEVLRSEDETPPDGFGAGFLVYRMASDFHTLCCLTGKDAALQELCEVIHAEFDRSRK